MGVDSPGVSAKRSKCSEENPRGSRDIPCVRRLLTGDPGLSTWMSMEVIVTS